VRNLAVIESLELEPGEGLNVVTGETGAGKSVLLSAVALLSGRRVSHEEIRTGQAEASVQAIFDTPALLQRARDLGLAADGESELLIARSISREGRGRVHVNGRLATVSVLSQLMADAVEVVSQGEHQRLLRPEVQTDLLDAYAGLGARVREVGELHAAWRACLDRLEERRSSGEARARRADQLRFEIEQIDAVEPRPGELAELEGEHARLAHVDRLGAHARAALDLLDDDPGVRDALARARAELEAGARLDGALQAWTEGLERARVEADDVALELGRYAEALESDPNRLAHVERRLAELARLQDRYGSSIDGILDHRARAAAELGDLDGGAERRAELEAELAQAAAGLERAARALSRARSAAAGSLADAVAAELAELEFGKARFHVRLEPVPGKTPEGFEAPSAARGRERAAFLLAANPGEEARRLRDAASGGELSRLLLALRNALREADGGGVLLFDEVDAGIAGRTARRVGERLRALGAAHQILCITHLPQIASLGSIHYHVRKRTRGGRTRTAVERLQGDDRVEEVARMSAGGRVTDVARAHARELLSAN